MCQTIVFITLILNCAMFKLFSASEHCTACQVVEREFESDVDEQYDKFWCKKCRHYNTNNNKYLLLTEFEGRTVSNGPSFFSSIYGPSAKRAGHKSKGKKRGSVTYSTDRANEVSKIFIRSLLCVWGAQERFLFTRNGFKFLTHLESETSQFETVFKSLARFNT